MSSFLAELAGEASQKLEAERAREQDRQTVVREVNSALERTFHFFNLFAKHLNALQPDIPRIYALDGKTRFSPLKWKSGTAEYRKQSLADNALFDHVLFQARLITPGPVTLSRRWELFDEVRKDLQAFGLKPMEDMHDLWRNRTPTVTFQLGLEPELTIRMRFQGNYEGGSVDLESNNVNGFGAARARLKPEALQAGLFDEIGRFLMGRTTSLPQELKLVRDLSRNV
jgi:hypothetical protein